MMMETARGRKTPDPTPDDVEAGLGGLDAFAEGFLVLRDSSDHRSSVRAAGSVDTGFLLEYEDGGRHFRSQREDLSLQEAKAVLVRYLGKDPLFSEGLSWREVTREVEGQMQLLFAAIFIALGAALGLGWLLRILVR